LRFGGFALKNLELSALVNLQSIDSEIYKLNELINQIPEQVDEQNETLVVFDNKMKEVQEEVSIAEKAQKDFEGQIQMLNEKLKEARSKQAMVKTNNEYNALSNEIENDKKKIDLIEESLLEKLEILPDLQEKIRDVESELKVEGQKVSVKIEELNSKKKSYEEELNNLIEEKNKLSSTISKNWLNLYETLLEGKRSLAVSPIVERNCQGCKMSETLQRFFEIRDSEDSIFTCSHCGRILYYKETEMEETSISAQDEVQR
tara:strand:+ start:176 stop:955 length:780 start_codon:yes stop_codon:yes gene_type:complete